MFRFQDNIPEIYINESRDFQLLSRLSDILFSGVKYDVDSMVNILDATLAKDRMLQLMCTKVGFFPNIEIVNQVLKYIIASFPYIIKNKGNEAGIRAAINAILKAKNNPDAVGEPIIIITGSQVEDNRDPYTIYIYTTVSIYNNAALKEVLRYVVPAGYHYKILSYRSIMSGYDNPDIIQQSDIIRIAKVNPTYQAHIRTSDFKDEDTNVTGSSNKFIDSSFVNAFDMTEISTSSNSLIEIETPPGISSALKNSDGTEANEVKDFPDILK